MNMRDKEKIKEIEKIKQEYAEKLAVLKLEQDTVLAEYLKDLEKKKMEELMNNLE